MSFKVKSAYRKIILTVLLAVLAVLILFPLILTVTNSLMSESEITQNYQMVALQTSNSHPEIFLRIILPTAKPGMAVLSILTFIDNWNMVEQPLIFLQDAAKQPLSVFLAQINQGEKGIAFAAATIYMLPMLLVFLYGENYVVEGIQLSGIKG